MTIQTERAIPTLTLGQRLTVSMEYAGMKPETLAPQMRCSAATIRNYIAGRTRIDYAHMRLWAEITRVDLDWLTGEADPVTRGFWSLVTGAVSDFAPLAA
jgi:hypothetical protein